MQYFNLYLGILFSLSHAEPESRLPYLRDLDWDALQSFAVREGEGLFLFVATKGINTDQSSSLSKPSSADFSEHRNRSRADKAVVSSIHQTMNKAPRMKNPSHVGTLTLTSSLDEIRTLIDETI
jgi:hypothetical protein